MNTPQKTNNDWQPIETAPRDGTEILAYEKIIRPDRVIHLRRVAWWHVQERETDVPLEGGLSRKERKVILEGFLTEHSIHPAVMYPTHWKPLPAPPI